MSIKSLVYSLKSYMDRLRSSIDCSIFPSSGIKKQLLKVLSKLLYIISVYFVNVLYNCFMFGFISAMSSLLYRLANNLYGLVYSKKYVWPLSSDIWLATNGINKDNEYTKLRHAILWVPIHKTLKRLEMQIA